MAFCLVKQQIGSSRNVKAAAERPAPTAAVLVTRASKLPGLLFTTTALSAALCLGANAQESVVQTYGMKCAGCHMGGGNVVQAGATLFPADLKRNGVDSQDTIYSLIYKGKGKMPGFGADCAPKGQCTFGPRLPDIEIQDLATYVLERAAADWK